MSKWLSSETNGAMMDGAKGFNDFLTDMARQIDILKPQKMGRRARAPRGGGLAAWHWWLA